MNTRLNYLKQQGESRILYLLSSLWAARHPGRFTQVKAFCLFLGHARSGHSLVGALLDAHPHAIISHELNVGRFVDAGFRAEQIYALIVRNSYAHAQAGRQWTGYSYAVPGQWQGTAEEIRLIGDKRGRTTTVLLNKKPDLLGDLKATFRVPLRFVHVIRNPFDNISTMARRNQKSLAHNINRYFFICEAVNKIKALADGAATLSVRHEDLIKAPRACLERICAHLDLEYPDDYASACASIVYSSPHRSREKTEWPEAALAEVEKQIDRFDFLGGYSFES